MIEQRTDFSVLTLSGPRPAIAGSDAAVQLVVPDSLMAQFDESIVATQICGGGEQAAFEPSEMRVEIKPYVFPLTPTTVNDGSYPENPTIVTDRSSPGQKPEHGQLFERAVIAFILLAFVAIVVDASTRRLIFGGTLILMLIVAALGLSATNAIAKRNLR